MNEKEVLNILKKTEAVLKGHFLLSSGLHSDMYFQMARVFQYPEYGRMLGQALAEKWKDKEIDVVIGPALGGIIAAYEVGRGLGKKAIFAERKDGEMQLRRGFSISKGEKVLVCEDVITTGGSVKEVLTIVENLGGIVQGIGCILQRGQSAIDYPVKSLVKVTANNYSPTDCPLCKEGIPLIKPGSRTV